MIHMKITEELPCKPLRVRWLCTTTKIHQERTVWNRLCTACEAFSAWALPTARRSPRQREPVVSVAPTNHVGSRASLSFMARGGLPRQLWPGAPIHQFPSQPSFCGGCNYSFPYSALLLVSKPRGPGCVSLFTARA